MKGARLLFIDDETGLLDLYETAFSREGYQVCRAATLEEARRLLEAGNIDLVVLDIRLAEESGLALLHEIKGRTPGLPVVLSTAYARYQDDFSSWLADAYVVKSSDLTELKRTVRACLEPRR
ncbi:MAG: response regulator [Thermoanaerobaculaceae bacterium]|nr:response regulator [Thermoanaerobaculaceae bacterium]